jgi:phosphate transport system protein
MATHYEESLQRDVDRIRGAIKQMASLAEGALEACLRALVERNRQLAYSVILRDQRIDALEKEIDRLCLEFIVRQQPVAKHLRFAYVTIKVNQEVERVGDYAESIARQILKLSGIPCPIPLDRYRQIASLSIPMLRDAVQAYLTENADLARRLEQVEEEVDGLKSVINAGVDPASPGEQDSFGSAQSADDHCPTIRACVRPGPEYLRRNPLHGDG